MQTKVPNYIGLYRTKTGIYVIRIAAPKDLKEKRKQVKREIKHSLRTRDWEKAKEAYHEFMRNLSSEMARCAIIPSNEPYPQDKFNEDVLEKAYDYYQQYSENVIPAFLQQINSPNDDEETRKPQSTINSAKEETLIKNEAAVNAKAEDKYTTLITAIANNSNPAVIENLIKKGANVNAKTKDGYTALMIASIENSNPAVIETLIKNGADVNAETEGGFTALMMAKVNNSNPAIIETLIKNGAKD